MKFSFEYIEDIQIADHVEDVQIAVSDMQPNGEPIHGEAEIALSYFDEICGPKGLPRGTVRRVQL